MKRSTPVIAGLIWYRREDYPAILKIMSDAHVLPDTYDDWLQRAEQGIEHHKSQGIVAMKAYIDPATFPDWCRARGLNVDAKARMEYANIIAAQNARQTH